MISIYRTTTPDILDATKRNLGANVYKNDAVIEALLEMQNFKCCYCEKKLTDIGTSERWVEHVIAKSEFKINEGTIDWNRANSWTNLLYSCATCNSKKGIVNVINPSDPNVDPEDHITFFVDETLICHISREGSDIGTITVNQLFVDRVDLYRALKNIKMVIDSRFSDIARAISGKDNNEVQSQINSLRSETCSTKYFSGFVRAYLKKVLFEFNQIAIPKLNKQFKTDFKPIEIEIATRHSRLL